MASWIEHQGELSPFCKWTLSPLSRGELGARFRCTHEPNYQEMIVQLFDFIKASLFQQFWQGFDAIWRSVTVMQYQRGKESREDVCAF
jgi:hypothetical protein